MNSADEIQAISVVVAQARRNDEFIGFYDGVKRNQMRNS